MHPLALDVATSTSQAHPAGANPRPCCPHKAAHSSAAQAHHHVRHQGQGRARERGQPLPRPGQVREGPGERGQGRRGQGPRPRRRHRAPLLRADCPACAALQAPRRHGARCGDAALGEQRPWGGVAHCVNQNRRTCPALIAPSIPPRRRALLRRKERGFTRVHARHSRGARAPSPAWRVPQHGGGGALRGAG